MRPSLALEQHRQAVEALANHHGVAQLRVFGSVLHGADIDGSDLDLLVEMRPDAAPEALREFRYALRERLGIRVDLAVPDGLDRAWRAEVLVEAQPLAAWRARPTPDLVRRHDPRNNRLPYYLERLGHAAQRAHEELGAASEEAYLEDSETIIRVEPWAMRAGRFVARIRDKHPDFIAAHPGVPWAALAELSDENDDGEHQPPMFEVVWARVHNDVPVLLAHLPSLCAAAAPAPP